MRGVDLKRIRADNAFMARGGLRHLRPARFRRSRSRSSVETLTLRISALVAERQTLRAKGGSLAALERNRVQIARAQWELGHALIDRYLPPAPAKTAA
jgi:hypothetical protein